MLRISPMSFVVVLSGSRVYADLRGNWSYSAMSCLSGVMSKAACASLSTPPVEGTPQVPVGGVGETRLRALFHSQLTSMTAPCGVSRQHPGSWRKVGASQEVLDKSRAGCNQPEDDSRKVSRGQR